MPVSPSPKSHFLEVINPSDVSVKLTVNGALPALPLAEKEAEVGMGVVVGAGASCSTRDGVSVNAPDAWVGRDGVSIDSPDAPVCAGGVVIIGLVGVGPAATQAISRADTRTATTPYFHLLTIAYPPSSLLFGASIKLKLVAGVGLEPLSKLSGLLLPAQLLLITSIKAFYPEYNYPAHLVAPYFQP